MKFISIIPIIIALIIFGLVVLVHEFGHFIIAVKNGILVEEFAIGMGPAIFKKKKGDTLYSIRLLPLGGYCKMLGENDNNDDKRSFNNKKVLQRILVVSAGAIMNFILAFLIIFILVFINGFSSTKVNTVLDNSPAKQSGILKGDKILKINNKRIHVFEDIPFTLMTLKDEKISLLILRNKEKIKLDLSPSISNNSRYYIGITSKLYSGIINKNIENYNKSTIFDTISQSFWTLIYYIKTVFWGITSLITFKVKADDMAGPLGIVNMIGDTYKTTVKISIWHTISIMANLTALISANLGVFNLLPLPALDGGRLLFLLIELFRGKPISQNKESLVHFIGFILLMILVIFVTFNDIQRIFF